MHLIIVDKDTNYGIEYSCKWRYWIEYPCSISFNSIKMRKPYFQFSFTIVPLRIVHGNNTHTKKKKSVWLFCKAHGIPCVRKSIFIIYNMYSEISVRVQCRKHWFPFTATSVDSATSQAQTTLTRNLRIQQLMLCVSSAFRMHPLFQLGSRCVCYKIAFDSSPDARSQPNFLLVFNRMHSPRSDSVSRKLSSS